MKITTDLAKILDVLLIVTPVSYRTYLNNIKKIGKYTSDQQALLNFLRNDNLSAIKKSFEIDNPCLDIGIKTVEYKLPRTKGYANKLIIQKARYGKSSHLQNGVTMGIEPTHQKYYIRDHKFTHFDV